MPLTASKTEADTSATTRDVTSGLVPPARTVSFIIPIHSSTGSGVAAEIDIGGAASSITEPSANRQDFFSSRISNFLSPKDFLICLNFTYQLPAFEQNDSWGRFSTKDQSSYSLKDLVVLPCEQGGHRVFEVLERRRPSSDKRRRDQATPAWSNVE